MTSQGQRFRRRALRRGYKVDEVDLFLDRVEATLNGETGSDAVSAQEVHDIVFRVRFGGYDEWQVDLHLDRIERQLTELEERGGGRGSDGRAMPPVDRGTPDRMMPQPDRMPPTPDLMGPPTVQVPPVPPMASGPSAPQGRASAAMPPHVAPQREPAREPVYGSRYSDPSYDNGPGYDSGYEPGRHGRAEMTTEIRLPGDQSFPGQQGPGQGGPGGSGYGGQAGVPGGPGGFSGVVPAAQQGGYPPNASGGPGFAGPSGATGTYSARSASTGQDYGPPQQEYGGQADFATGGYAAPVGPAGAPGGGMHLSGDAARVDQLRRTFQLRRFGSGYDRTQVDGLFDLVVASLSGRAPAVSEKDLDPTAFALVPGGYFEAEVNAALREVRDLVFRRR